MRSFRLLLMIIIALPLAACATPPAAVAPIEASGARPISAGAAPSGQIVVLVGLDGLRADAIDRFPDAAPNLRALAARGVRADMVPAMPSLTFVNFYSIATGLHPERHGITSNSAHSRALGRTMLRTDHPQTEWWGGEPIWATAEKQGVKTAAMFWLGSEAKIAGVRPTHWFPYDHLKPYPDRTRQILDWLALDEAKRPRLITVYYHAVDSAAHAFGVGSPEEKNAIAVVDKEVGDLVAGVAALGLGDRVNFIVVSDHGMTNVPPANIVHLDDYLSHEGVYIPEHEGPDGAGVAPLIHLYAERGNTEEIFEALSGAHPHLRVYRRAHLPERWRLDNADRTGDVVAVADAGWLLWGRSLVSKYEGGPPKGMHGYDRHLPEMLATFIADGPDFADELRAEPFDNVEVYGLIAEILGIAPAATDGELARVEHLLTPHP